MGYKKPDQDMVDYIGQLLNEADDAELVLKAKDSKDQKRIQFQANTAIKCARESGMFGANRLGTHLFFNEEGIFVCVHKQKQGPQVYIKVPGKEGRILKETENEDT